MVELVPGRCGTTFFFSVVLSRIDLVRQHHQQNTHSMAHSLQAPQ